MDSFALDLSFSLQCILLGVGLFSTHMIVRDALNWGKKRREADKKRKGKK